MLKESDDQDPYNLIFGGSDDQSPKNWRRMCESNKKSRHPVRAWLQRFSSNPSLPRTLSTPLFASDLPKSIAMSNNSMHQTPKDQFLHWRQEMERKQEEKERQMHELQARTECLQRDNDQLRS